MGDGLTVYSVTGPRRRFVILAVCLLACAVFRPATAAARQLDTEGVKSIRGVVRDLRGEPVAGARVFIRNLSSNVIRTHSTDGSGLYSVNGLPSDADYEVRAEYQGTESETRLVSAFFERSDNVLNFDLPVAVLPAGGGVDEDGAILLETFDRVQLHASFTLPEGIPAPIPVALLLHGYGENRSVWMDLETRLLETGWAVMTVDLRGHGRSTTRNNSAIEPSESWRTDPQQFPLDLEPVLDWLKTRPRLDSARMAVIGADVGANLALVASGRFPEVATSVAINPNIDEAVALAGTGQAFSPRMVQIVVANSLYGLLVREQVQGGSRITSVAVEDAASPTPIWLATGDTLDQIVRWLRDTY